MENELPEAASSTTLLTKTGVVPGGGIPPRALPRAASRAGDYDQLHCRLCARQLRIALKTGAGSPAVNGEERVERREVLHPVTRPRWAASVRRSMKYLLRLTASCLHGSQLPNRGV